MLSRKGGSRFNEEKKGVKTDGIRREGPFPTSRPIRSEIQPLIRNIGNKD